MKVGIIGGSGYAGGEMLRLLLRHPDVEVTRVTSRRLAGEFVHFTHSNLRGVTSLKFAPYSLSDIADSCDLVVCATPHGVTKDTAPSLLEAGLRVIDLSADYRLKDPDAYPEWYGWDHPNPGLLEKAILGLPELHRNELKDADLVACPGCMAGASILALAPLVREGLIESEKIVVDAKIGSSGGGSSPRTLATTPSDSEASGLTRLWATGTPLRSSRSWALSAGRTSGFRSHPTL